MFGKVAQKSWKKAIFPGIRAVLRNKAAVHRDRKVIQSLFFAARPSGKNSQNRDRY